MEAEGTLRRRVGPALILGGIFAVALFIRAFFAFDLALRDFLVSGGSDAFYFGWILDNIVTTGRHLLQDQMLNFPVGMLNPRPPIYAWSVALVGMLAGTLQGSVSAGVGQTFLFSTAVWGALTIFPTYFLAKEMFGRRTAYVAAFFLALLPAHIQRTPLSNGDHDALVLFFVVVAFYFLLKALRELKERSWVDAWWRPRAVVRGLRDVILENRRTVLLSIMAGTALSTIALTWKGWAYAVVIIIVYFLAQLLVHKIRNQDPLGILLVFAVTLSTAHLLAAPYYVITNQVGTWFDVPLYLFLASLGIGLVFAIFHRLPWMLVVPPIILGFLAGTAIAAVYSPTVASAVGSGLGYFVPNKVFETIAEAQPPNLSQVILSFGAVTFYFSLAGVALLGLQFIRRPRPDFLFVLVWMVAAIFMALSAVRFLFNASPAFAITAAWVVILVVERLGLEQVGKAVATTGGSRLGALRKGIKVRHIAGVFLVAFLVVLPNTWFAVDAGSPFEVKEDLEEEVLRVTPDFLRPPQADQGLFYFGAFGFSLPLPNRYFPQAWSWLREQDTDVIPVWDRPAFLSWWDYGFEAIQEGRHPTVADNFQNGLEFAGHFLTSQSENEGVAVLNVRLLFGDLVTNRGQFTPATEGVLVDFGFDPDHIFDALTRPALFIPLIRAEPERFRAWDARLSANNARIIYLRTVFVEGLDLEAQTAFYRSLRVATEGSVGYFAVDSRLIPFSGTNTGIFYAVAKLTDHPSTELPDGRSIPVDFYRLIAVTPQGEFDLDKVPPGAQVSDIRIEYLEPWYNSMLYRIFFGPDGESLGRENDGLPGLSGELERIEPRHGWMLNHFNLVYRTAYFNPHPPEEALNFTEDFTALNIFDALELQRQIDAGEIEGLVDVSPRSGLQQGIVILRYYDGAILRGQVTTDAGTPVAGVRVTAVDSLGTPHSVTFTDSRGLYETNLPFGQVGVVVSTGPADNATGIGTPIAQEAFNISEAQALRLPLDEEGTGLPDFVIEHSFVVEGASFVGTAFIDTNRNGQQDPEDRPLAGLEVVVRDLRGNAPDVTTVTALDGSFEAGDLVPSRYRLGLLRLETEIAGFNATVNPGEQRGQDVIVSGAAISGILMDEFGQPIPNGTARLVEDASGDEATAVSSQNGSYQFAGLFAGSYAIEAETGSRMALTQRVSLAPGRDATLDLRLEPRGELRGRSLLAFAPTPHVTLTLQRRGEAIGVMTTSDVNGEFTVHLQQGIYDVYSVHFAGGRTHAFLGMVSVGPGSMTLEANLRLAHRVDGIVTDGSGNALPLANVTFEQEGARLGLVSDTDGSFVTFLPTGQYEVSALSNTAQFASTVVLEGPTSLSLRLSTGLPTQGRVFRDLDGNGTWQPGEGLAGIQVRMETASVPTFSVVTGADGAFRVPLLANADYVWSIEEQGFASVQVGPLPPNELRLLGPIELVADSIAVTGQLTSADPLSLKDVEFVFEAIGGGAVTAPVTAGPQGAFTAPLQPGSYRIVVDTNPPSGDESRRIQALVTMELSVSIGGTVAPLDIPVVERVRVQGTLDVGGAPLGQPVLFDGPDQVTVNAEGSYVIYLRRGVYTVHGATEELAPHVLLASLDVLDPTDFSASFEAGIAVSGALRVDGGFVLADVFLNFTRTDGARVGVPSDPNARYTAALLPGTYTVTSAWLGVDRLDGVPRFAGYQLDQTVIVADDAPVDLFFARELVTRSVVVRVLLGEQPASARVSFQAANATAVDAEFEVPSGGLETFALAPGVYDVYAFRTIGNSAGLTKLGVLVSGLNEVTVRLELGHRLFGVASLSDGSRREAELRFTSPTASARFPTDALGGYAVFLPGGTYDFVVSTERDEGGVAVEYRFEDSFTLEGSTLLNPRLERVDVRTLGITWDPAQRTLLAPGETVLYTVTVTNTGNRADTFTFEGQPAEWFVSFRPSRVTLPFGTGNQAVISVQIEAPEDALVDHAPLSVVGRSTSDATVSSSANVDVDIVHERGISLRLSKLAPVLDEEALRYQIQVKNDGNGDDTYALILTNPEVLAAQGWTAELRWQDITGPDAIGGIFIEAGSFETIELRLEATGRVSASTATFVAFVLDDRSLESALDVAVELPSLQIPRDALEIEGKNVRLGPPEFPVLLYGALAAAAVGLTVLFITYGRRRRRRR